MSSIQGKLILEKSDILENGNGNKVREGVGAGHSGVYQERGSAEVDDCNISGNRFTGFSGTNRGITTTSITNCDFFANNADSIEVRGNSPRCILDCNNCGRRGVSRMRSMWGPDVSKVRANSEYSFFFRCTDYVYLRSCSEIPLLNNLTAHPKKEQPFLNGYLFWFQSCFSSACCLLG